MQAVSCCNSQRCFWLCLAAKNVTPDDLKVKEIILNTEREGETTFRYLAWHYLNVNNWKNYKFLVVGGLLKQMRCICLIEC